MGRFFVFLVALGALFVLGTNFAHAADPRGRLDHAAPDAIFGWAWDADAPTTPVTVHIYVDGTPTVSLTANQHRGDLVAAGITSDPYHGFGWVPEGLASGTHTIAAYAINIGGGTNPLLPTPRTLVMTSALPRGVLDNATPALISGWAYDADAGSSPVEVHIYIDGVHRGTVSANDRRDDLVAAGVASDPYHGFTWNPPVLAPGEHTISVWTINSGGGGNPGRFLPRGDSNPTGGIHRQACWCSGGGGHHRQPQPPGGQRIQGLRSQRGPDHPPGGHRDRRCHR